MALHPILSALRRHRAGVVLIALQIALTLAIVCNTLFIISERLHTVSRPTGMDERDLFFVSQLWVGAPSEDQPDGVARLDALQREDLAALRNMPDVASVSPATTLPLFSSSRTGSVSLSAGHGEYDGDSPGTAHVAYFFTDEQAQQTLGIWMAAGRFFHADEVQHGNSDDVQKPRSLVISTALAAKMFPGMPVGSVVGRALYIDGGSSPMTVVGVMDALQAPGRGIREVWNTAILPMRMNTHFSHYAIRAKPGRLEQAMKATPGVLYAVNPMRVLDEQGILPFAKIRKDAYEADVGMAILMSFVCLILLAVTAAGIVGLTSFWVAQRNRQIGVRRALGARKVDILRYFQAENLAIAGGGACAGVFLAIGLNVWLMGRFAMERLPLSWIGTGVVIVLLLGQLAVFVPARRASNVPPVVATRAA